MYDKSDPRASLAPDGLKPAATEFAAAEYARFYDSPPQISDSLKRQWFARGQNFILSYVEAQAGAEFVRDDQLDEYAVVLPDASTSAEITWGGQANTVEGASIAFVPPGPSRIRMTGPGRLLLLWTSRSKDLCELCVNAASYALEHPNIPTFEPWPMPSDGWKLRPYRLEVPDEPGRFGRIWRCSTLMINFTPAQVGPRDVTKLSPHHHDTFEQGSLALAGAFMHHIRWPWTPNLNSWRDDDHELCEAPSLAVIPPPAVHTSRGMTEGLNQLVDIFSPPRTDFSLKPGWVLNAADYPMP